MRVRMQRTTTVPTTGKGGMPRQSVKRMQTLTVGAGYDLPDDVADELVKRGEAVAVDENGRAVQRKRKEAPKQPESNSGDA